MELFSSNIKKFQKTETLKKIPYISRNGNPKIASYILGNGTFQYTQRNSLFQEMEALKKFLIFSQKKAFLIFRETKNPKKLFIFQETELYYISENPKKLSETKN